MTDQTTGAKRGMAMPLSASELKDLRHTAERATQGKWEVAREIDGRTTITRVVAGGSGCVARTQAQAIYGRPGFQNKQAEANALHIATFDPPTAIGLIDEVEKGREQQAIVARIWAMLGSPTYEELAGDSIYDVLAKRFANEARAEARVAALEGALKKIAATRLPWGEGAQYDDDATLEAIIKDARSILSGEGGGRQAQQSPAGLGLHPSEDQAPSADNADA